MSWPLAFVRQIHRTGRNIKYWPLPICMLPQSRYHKSFAGYPVSSLSLNKGTIYSQRRTSAQPICLGRRLFNAHRPSS